MLDPNAELEENRQLDKLLNVLASQTDIEDESEEDSDSDLEIEDQDDDESDEDNVLNTPILPTKPLKIDRITSEQLSNQLSLSNLYQNISFEEFDLITDCKDADLKELMILNRAKHVHLKSLINKYEEMLSDCEWSLRLHLINLHKRDNNGSGQVARINRFGFSYFNHFKSRPISNTDFQRKKSMNIVNLSYESRKNRWVQLDLIKLKSCVMFNYYSNYLTREGVENFELGELPLTTNRNVWRKKFDEIIRRIRNLDSVTQATELPKIGDDTYLDWDFIADNHYKDIGRAASLKAMWNNYVHPNVNRHDFTDEEIKKIVVYVHQHPDTNWQALSKYLNTNRSEHQLCMQYQISLYIDPPDRTEDTTVSECIIDLTDGETNIQNLISSWKNFPAAGVTKEYQRILKREQYLNGIKDCRRGNFSLAEDTRILALVKKYGLDFQTISAHMPTRSCGQIQNRYWNTLCQQEKLFANWSLREDEEILEHVRVHGEQKWSLLTQILPRNSAQLRHRYARLKKKLESDPNFDLATMTRRHGFEGYARRHRQIKLRAQMTDEELEKVIATPNRRIRMRTDLDEQLVSFFSPLVQLKKSEPIPILNEAPLKNCVSAIKLLLSIFNTTLHIPGIFTEDNCSELDSTDVEILKMLTGTNDSSQENKGLIEIKPEVVKYSLIPPNEGSLQVLRYLLLQSFGSISINRYNFPEGDHIDHCKDIFKAFLHLPSLLSIIEPDDSLCPIKIEKAKSPPVVVPKKRKPGRPRKRKNIEKEAIGGRIQRTSRVIKNKLDVIEKVKETEKPKPVNKQSENGKELDVIATSSSSQPLQITSVADTKVLIPLDKATIAKLKKQNILQSVRLVEFKKPCVIISRENVQVNTEESRIVEVANDEMPITKKDFDDRVDVEYNSVELVEELKEKEEDTMNLPIEHIKIEEEHLEENPIEESVVMPDIKAEPTRVTRSKTAAEMVMKAAKVVRSYGNKRKLGDTSGIEQTKKTKSDSML